MTSEAETRTALLRDIGHIIKLAAGPGVGFVLFLEVGSEWSYLANAERADVVTMLEEWLGKTRGIDVTKQRELPNEIDDRLALERKCARLGTMIGTKARLLIFMFDFGEGGDLAWYTNLEGAWVGVTRWVASQKGLS